MAVTEFNTAVPGKSGGSGWAILGLLAIAAGAFYWFVIKPEQEKKQQNG